MVPRTWSADELPAWLEMVVTCPLIPPQGLSSLLGIRTAGDPKLSDPVMIRDL